MARRVRLRPWQKRALDRLAESGASDFLAVATPGAGKTTFALCAAVSDLAANPGRRLVVVAPTSHLKVQWADAAARLGLYLEPSWSPTGGSLPADMHGLVTTYQQVASSPRPLRGVAAGAMVILDEVHHAGDERSWGTAVREAFEVAPRRLSLSGTPFRSDTRAIPFVRYVGDEAVPDFEYGYADALADGRVVRPVYFPRINGFMEWVAPDGNVASASFDDPLDRTAAAQRLRTALSVDGEWLPTVLLQANERLQALRRQQPDAAGLVIATDQDHAKGIADLLQQRCGVRPTLAVSDDPRSSIRIARFAAATDPWIVAVRMISEGVDIPRLRLGVYATTTTTELFFRQAVGRFVRWVRGVPRQKAYLFIPNDARLRTLAVQIADARRHSLARVRRDGDGDGDGEEEAGGSTELDEQVHEDDRSSQLSLFAPLSSIVTDEGDFTSVFDADDEAVGELDRREGAGPIGRAGEGGTSGVDDDRAEAGEGTSGEGDGLELSLPPLGGGPPASTVPGAEGAANRREKRMELRERNQKLVQELVWATGQTHAQVNSRLNRLVGVRRIDEATLDQLARRARQAERWLGSL